MKEPHRAVVLPLTKRTFEAYKQDYEEQLKNLTEESKTELSDRFKRIESLWNRIVKYELQNNSNT